MSHKISRIQVFEHQSLYVGREYDGVLFSEGHFFLLVKLNDFHNNKYFTILHRGVKCSQYVGVVQVGDLCIEILPKLDNSSDNKSLWQGALIEMLKFTKRLNVANVGEANVKKQNIHLLDIYVDWFLNEIQTLERRGLIKKYRRVTANTNSLKGKLLFSKHISENLIHKERFYNSHQVYDHDHKIHQILFVALKTVESLSKGSWLHSKCKITILDFPAVSTIQVNAETFKNITISRKNSPYKKALEIAKLIILNFAPNISLGREKMIAILFDMNVLWEDYVFQRLRFLADSNLEIKGQMSKSFWSGVKIRPDIVISYKGNKYIIDTKWKNLNGFKPSADDLRQMYVYNDYWGANKSILLYPSTVPVPPNFITFDSRADGDVNHQCGLGFVSVFQEDTVRLNRHLGLDILGYLD